MSQSLKPTILCIASFFKGNEFIRQCKRQGANVLLLTREKLADYDWARESLDELVTIRGPVTLYSYLSAASQLARRWRISRIVALEEYDILTAAQIREHFCLPGMSTTTARCFQDKLAMRDKARNVDIPHPSFVGLFNSEAIDEFLRNTTGPWMLKPRIGASAMGIKRIYDREDVWRAIAELDTREEFHETSAFHLLEQYIPGDVYHVDSLVEDGKIAFAYVGHYCSTPFEIAQGGGVNVSHTVRHESREERDLLSLNKALLERFGFIRGVTHAEFIHRSGSAPGGERLCTSHNEATGEFLFLEVAARVGGAYTAETIESASGINLWREWARIELATVEQPYELPAVRKDYGGIAVSLARQENPDTSGYSEREIVYRINKPWHVGLVVRTSRYDRLMDLMETYRYRFGEDFTAVAPPEEKPRTYL